MPWQQALAHKTTHRPCAACRQQAHALYPYLPDVGALAAHVRTGDNLQIAVFPPQDDVIGNK